MNNKKIYVFGIFLTVLIFLMIGIYIGKISISNKFIILNGKKELSKEIELDNLFINPGSSEELSMEFITLKSRKYNFHIDIDETCESILHKYIHITIIVDDEIIYENNLSDLLNQNISINYMKFMTKKQYTKINIIYSIPKDVGNEIEGKNLNVSLKLLIRKIG